MVPKQARDSRVSSRFPRLVGSGHSFDEVLLFGLSCVVFRMSSSLLLCLYEVVSSSWAKMGHHSNLKWSHASILDGDVLR